MSTSDSDQPITIVRSRQSCSHCHEMNDAGAKFCHNCGHRADLPRLLCDCARCQPFTSSTPETPLFVGYAKLEQLVARHNPNEKLIIGLVTSPGRPGQMGAAAVSLWIIIQEISGNQVHYCRILMGKYIVVNGDQPLGDGQQRARERGPAAYRIVLDWLRAQGIEPLEGVTVAEPDNLTLLAGHAGFMRYDRESDCFVLVDSAGEA